MHTLHVAVAIIYNAKSQVLIAKRRAGKHLAGFWEFPGGKLNLNESVFSALVREIFEEVNVKVTAAEPLIKISHQYPEKNVLLDVWEVEEFQGAAIGKEGQEIKWAAIKDLANYQFPSANQAIINVLRKRD